MPCGALDIRSAGGAGPVCLADNHLMGSLAETFKAVLSDDVRPLLKTHGFAKSGTVFRRRRPPLWDVIAFQGSKWNGLGATNHGFFVNVGVGSIDIDIAYHGAPPAKPTHRDSMLDRRWEDLIPGIPAETAFDATTDMAQFTDQLRRNLTRLLAVVDSLDSTDALASHAARNNLLNGMQMLCAYLASSGDTDRLYPYLAKLRTRFGPDSGDPRWDIFNRQITEAVGDRADELRAAGLLDS